MKSLTQKKLITTTIFALLFFSFSTNMCKNILSRMSDGAIDGAWQGSLKGVGYGLIAGGLIGSTGQYEHTIPFIGGTHPTTVPSGLVIYGGEGWFYGGVNGAFWGSLIEVTSPKPEVAEQRKTSIISWTSAGLAMGLFMKKLCPTEGFGTSSSGNMLLLVGYAAGLVIGMAGCLKIVSAESDIKPQSTTPPPAPTQQSLVSLNLNLN